MYEVVENIEPGTSVIWNDAQYEVTAKTPVYTHNGNYFVTLVLQKGTSHPSPYQFFVRSRFKLAE